MIFVAANSEDYIIAPQDLQVKLNETLANVVVLISREQWFYNRELLFSLTRYFLFEFQLMAASQNSLFGHPVAKHAEEERLIVIVIVQIPSLVMMDWIVMGIGKKKMNVICRYAQVRLI